MKRDELVKNLEKDTFRNEDFAMSALTAVCLSDCLTDRQLKALSLESLSH